MYIRRPDACSIYSLMFKQAPIHMPNLPILRALHHQRGGYALLMLYIYIYALHWHINIHSHGRALLCSPATFLSSGVSSWVWERMFHRGVSYRSTGSQPACTLYFIYIIFFFTVPGCKASSWSHSRSKNLRWYVHKEVKLFSWRPVICHSFDIIMPVLVSNWISHSISNL